MFLSRRRNLKRVRAGHPCRVAGAGFALFLFLALWLGLSLPAHAYIIINAPMTDTNASGWVLGGNPTSAYLTGTGGAAPNYDPVGQGWLRLTNTQTSQTGFAYHTTSFDLSSGVLIQFDYASWGGSNPGADGASIFLFDGNVSNFNVGAFGGSLGYAQKMANNAICNGGVSVSPSVAGLSGGYVGIGLDEYGNYAACSEGRYKGWNTNSSNLDANTVTIRGPVVGFGGGATGATLNASSYPWVYTSPSTTGNGGLYTSGGSARPSQTGTAYRKVMIQISPAPNPQISVWIQFGYNTVPVQVVSNQPLPAISPSQTLKVGFGASTGSLDNYHDVRNLLITTLGQDTSIDLSLTKTAVTTGTSTQISNANVGTSFQYLLTATNNGPNDIYAPGVGIADSFPSNITAGSWNCSVVSSGSSTGGSTKCPTPSSGTGNINSAINLTKGGAVAFTVNATVNSMPTGNSLSNTASLTIPGSVTDYYSGNDSATSTITSYAPLVVTKSFSPSTVTATGTSSTMTVTLTNPNNVAANGVTFTDSYPTGLKNANPASVTNSCGGTYTGANNGTSLALTGTGNTIPANGSCSISIKVLGSTLGTTYTNTIAAAAVGTTTANVPANATAASASLTLMSPATVSKAFAPTQVGTNLPSLLSVTINNPNAVAITGAQFTDSYPAGMVNTGGQGGSITGTTGCTGTVTAANGGNSLALTNGVIPANGSCTYSTYVSAPSAGTYNNTTPALTTGNAGNTAAGANVPLTVLNPPTATVAFASPGTILPNGTSVMTVTLTNPNSTAITGASFSDTYPAGLFNTTALNVATTCTNGTASATNTGNSGSSGTLSLSGATIPANGSCKVTVTTTSATTASYSDATGAISTTNAGTGSSASGNLVVMAPLAVTKSFTPNSVVVGGTSVLTIVLANPNSVAVTGAGYTDSYPSNMKNTATPQATVTGTGCTGTTTAANNGTSVRLASATVPANSSCTLSVNVTISASGAYTNTIPAGGVTTGNTGANTDAASANLNGPQAPTLSAAFADTYLAAGDDTNLTLTIGNANGVAITLSSLFTDALPTGMTVKSAGNTGTCSGVTASAGAGSFTMASGTSIPVGGCTIVVNVTSATPGAAVDTLNAGDLKTSMGNNAAASTGTLYVYAPPTVTKSFAPASISYGGTSTMTITVGNPAANPGNLTGVSIADSYTGSLVNNAVGSVVCSGGGSATLTGGGNGGNSVGFNAGVIVPGGNCVITQGVSATSTTLNSTGAPAATGPVALTGTPASATLTVAPLAPTVTASFGLDSMAGGGNTSLTLTIGNGNAGAISLSSAFTDTLPAGMTIGTAGNTGTCGGVTATAGAGSFSMASGTAIPAGGCTVIVNVASSTAGAAVNTIPAGGVQTGAGSNVAAASDTLNVYAPPTVTLGYSTSNSTIPAGGTTTLTVTVTNPAANPGNLTGVSISDAYNGTLSNSDVGSVSCTGGGSATLTGGTKGGTAVGFSAGTIVPGGSCTISQSVTATSNNTNTTGAPAATGPVALAGQPASISLTAVQQSGPTVAMAFSPTQAEVSPGTSTLTITLGNPSQNSVALTSVAFSNTLPSGLVVASGAVVTSSCGGSTAVLSGNRGISLSGGTIPVNGSCFVAVPVSSSSTGSYTASVAAGDVTSANASSNPSGASAKLTVATVAAPVVSVSFNPSQIGVNITSALTISITNNNNTVALSGVNFTDSLPIGLTVVNGSGISTNGSCGATAAVAVASDNLSFSLGSGTIASKATCTVTVTVTSAMVGSYNNSVSVNTTNAGTGSGSATLNVLQAPTVTVQFTPSLTTVNNASALTFTLYNPNNIAIAGAGFTDNYPSGLVNAALASGSCSGSSGVCNCQAGTVTAANGGNSLAFSGGTIPGNATCTISVNVLSAAAGSYSNSNSGSVSVATSNAGAVAAAPVTLIVSGPPTVRVAKTASSPSGKPGEVITYTVTVTNPSSGYAGNVVLTDLLNPSYSYLGYTSFQFREGAVPSGLTMGQVLFDNGTGWGYAAGSDRSAPANYDGTVTRWQIPMIGTMNPNSSFTITYGIMIK